MAQHDGITLLPPGMSKPSDKKFTEFEKSNREELVQLSGVQVKDLGSEQLYPAAGVPLDRERPNLILSLPIISVQHLVHAPTLKSWLEERQGKTSCPEHEKVVQYLKDARANGAPIMLNVNDSGFYDRAFSGANGNSVSLDELWSLWSSGLTWGQVLVSKKLVSGANGLCGGKKPCQQCSEIRNGGLDGGKYIHSFSVRQFNKDGLGDDDFSVAVRQLIATGDYRLLVNRIHHCETSSSVSLDEARNLMRETGEGLLYVLEILGVFRPNEAASNTALKRMDLGGH